MRSAMMRATTSVDPPGGNGTISVICRDGQIAVMKGVEHGEIALTGNTEYVTHAIDDQLVDQHFGGGSGIVLGAHDVVSDARSAQRLIGANLAGIIKLVRCSSTLSMALLMNRS